MFTATKACDSCGHGKLCAIKMDYEQYLNAIEYAEKSALSAMSPFGNLDMSIRDKYFTTNAHCGLWVMKQLYSEENSAETANYGE